MLVEGCDNSDALNRTLNLRKEALRSCLVVRPSVSSRVQISEFVSLLIASVRCINFVFSCK